MAIANPWDAYAAGLTLRGYQQRAMASFDDACDNAKNAFYLVAPPGSGKTLMGLLMANKRERPAVCLSPNAAIQMQWVQRVREHWVCVDPTVSKFQSHPSASVEPGEPTQALTSLTYQRLSVRGPNDDPHPNVVALHEALRAARVETLILDECHHLSADWGRAVDALRQSLGDPFVIALTATPVPRDRGPVEHLHGDPDHQISLPSVIRHGDLAPFQDLCHIVAPTQEEEDLLRGSLSRLEALFEQLQRGEPDRFSLDMWCEMLELEPKNARGKPYEDLFEFAHSEPELATAWARHLTGQDKQPPVGLGYQPEYHEPATTADRLVLATQYAARYLLVECADSPTTVHATEVLAEWGHHVTPGRVTRRVSEMSRTMGYSRQKLQAVVDILRTEIRVMGDDLRALILCDYEFPPKGREGLSCVDVIDLVTSVVDVDVVDPILITGKSLLVDDDLWGTFRDTCDKLCKQHEWSLEIEKEAERGYWRLSGSGPEWNTRVQVALVTHMLEQGITKCVVSTRALLGEGWDCLRLNTLIDLTVVTSGVSVNQMRGRTLRKDPDNPTKVSNNWDVLCSSSLGDGADLQRLIRKHERVYGITDDGQVERGIGHIHACFDRASAVDLAVDRDQVVDMMHRRAEDRAGARQRWRIGDSFRDVEYPVLSFHARPAARKRSRRRSEDAPRDTELELVLLPTVAARARRSMAKVALAGFAVAGGAVAGALAVWAPLVVAGIAPLVWMNHQLRKSRSAGAQTSTDESELASLARVVATAYAEMSGTVPSAVIGRRDDGTVRVTWKNVDSDDAQRLTMALAETIGPIVDRRYLLVESLRRVSSQSAWRRLSSPGDDAERAYSVPRMFARKGDAQKFLSAWRSQRNADAQVHHAASEAGQQLYRRWLSTRPLGGETSIRLIWS